MDRFALALGSGGARGLAHIHVIKALDDLGLRPEIVAGTSIGSIMGAAFAAGYSGDEIEEHVLTKVGNPFALLGGIFKVRPSTVQAFLAEGGLRIGEVNLERILGAFLPDDMPATFEDLKLPLRVAATDFYAEKTTVFRSGDLGSALAASAALPAVFLPVQRGGRYYIDGSATSPCPIDVVAPHADHILAIDVAGGSHGDEDRRPGKLDAMYASSQIMQASIIRACAAEHPKAVVLRPPVGGVRALDFLKAKAILEQTAQLREDVKSQLDILLLGAV